MRERMGFRKRDLYHRLLADQYMIRELTRSEEDKPEEIAALHSACTEYAAGVEGLGMRDWVLGRPFYPVPFLLAATTGLLILSPVFLYGFVTSFPLYYPIGKFSGRFKDKQFHSSVKFVLGTFLFPVYYLLLFIAVWIFTEPGWIKWAFLGSLPVTGITAHTWFIWFRKIRSLWKYELLTLFRNKKLAGLKALRNRIISEAEQLIRDPEKSNV